MKNNRKQLALRLALCVLAAVVVWVFVDNYGPDGSGPVTYTKWFRDVPISYTSETVLTDRGLMLLDEGTTQTVDLEIEGSHWDLAMLDSDYLRVTVDLAGVTRTGSQTAPSVTYGYTFPYFSRNVSVDPGRHRSSPSTWRSSITRRWTSAARSPAMWRRATPPVSSRSLRPRWRSGATRRMWTPSAM